MAMSKEVAAGLVVSNFGKGFDLTIQGLRSWGEIKFTASRETPHLELLRRR